MKESTTLVNANLLRASETPSSEAGDSEGHKKRLPVSDQMADPLEDLLRFSDGISPSSRQSSSLPIGDWLPNDTPFTSNGYRASPLLGAVTKSFKSTNSRTVFVSLDRVSQYLVREVIYHPELPTEPEEIVFRILLFKLFNSIPAWEVLVQTFGTPAWKEFNEKAYAKALGNAWNNGRGGDLEPRVRAKPELSVRPSKEARAVHRFGQGNNG